MAKHLSIRLPWHDRGWDGRVCDRPTANVYCIGEYGLKAHNIRDGKKDAEEENLAGQACSDRLCTEYRPPCLRTIQTFGGAKPLEFYHEPKSFLSTPERRVRFVPDSIKPYTAGTWPYDRVFRREEADEEVNKDFIERYSPEEARLNLSQFFAELDGGQSLVFFYLNYDNPLNSESRRYVLVGAAEIDSLSPQHEWEGMEPDRARLYGTFVWNRFVTHGYGDGRGARIPYERYLQKGFDPGNVLVEIPDDLSRHFKYVCRGFSDDEATILLQYLINATQRGAEEHKVDWEWSRQLQWLNSALDRAWTNRGAFPGLAPALEVIGFQRATIYVKTVLADPGIVDARAHVLARLGDPQVEPDAGYRRQFSAAANTLRVLPHGVSSLLFDRLALMDLTTRQLGRIVGHGLVTDKDRLASGIRFTVQEVHENPYLIVEQYLPSDDDPVPFYRVDNGIFLPQNRTSVSIPGIEDYRPDDARRLRAAIHVRLRGAHARGHSFLSQADVIEHLETLQLPGAQVTLGTLALARDLEFFEQGLKLVRDGETVAWMLPTQWEDEELIRLRVRKLRQRPLLAPSQTDWAGHLPPVQGLPPDIADAARSGQVGGLQRLAVQAFSLLVGGAGTGKTTVLGALVKGLLTPAHPEKLLLLAPTGKAAVRLRKRVKEVAGIQSEPTTIHSFLVRWEWMDGETFRLKRDGIPADTGATTVIIDEASMLDVPMLATTFRALDWTCIRRVILCGDPQQLPPIGVGAPFKNLVDASRSGDAVSTPCELSVNVRQVQANSTALRLAQQFSANADRVAADELLEDLRKGGRLGNDLEIRFFSDEHDLRRQLPEVVAKCVDDLLAGQATPTANVGDELHVLYDQLHRINVKGELPRLDAFEVLSPYRAGYYGSDELNREIQRLLRQRLLDAPYPNALGKPSGRRFIWPDKVLQTQNKRLPQRFKLAWDRTIEANVDLFVANGELGQICKIDTFKRERFARVSFETSANVSVKVNAKWAEDSLDLGYAMTVHKAQGSDFGGVLLVLPAEARQILISRELLYTALTRFTKRLYLLVQGQPGDLGVLYRGMWPGASEYQRRNTSLYGCREAIKDLDDYQPENRIHKTLRSELVASKSEVLIANELHRQHIPYYYEKLLLGPDGSRRRPDFTIPIETPDGPDVRYWEHWGMLGDPAYDASVHRRLEWYKKHGFFSKLIQTDERHGFDSPAVETLVREQLLP